MNQLYRATVGAFIVNREGKLLITLKHGFLDKWNMPKGGVEPGESYEQALRRELKEELGIDEVEILQKSKISIIYEYPADFKPIQQEGIIPVGQAQKNYWVSLPDKVVFNIPNKEIEKYTWIDIDPKQIKKYFGPHDSEGILQTFLPIEWRGIEV